MKLYIALVLLFLHVAVWGMDEPAAVATSYSAKTSSAKPRTTIGERIKIKIGTPNDPELIAPFNTIIELYDKADYSNDGWRGMTNADKETLIQTLQKISVQFKGKTAEDECPDLFRFMMINTYFSLGYINIGMVQKRGILVNT